ncbi:MAG: hypothetical protein U0797_30015 [Gemmataceae bacterium]
MGFFALVMAFPAVQLASAVFLFVFALPAAGPVFQLAQVGRITGGLVVGTAAGLLACSPCAPRLPQDPLTHRGAP